MSESTIFSMFFPKFCQSPQFSACFSPNFVRVDLLLIGEDRQSEFKGFSHENPKNDNSADRNRIRLGKYEIVWKFKRLKKKQSTNWHQMQMGIYTSSWRWYTRAKLSLPNDAFIADDKKIRVKIGICPEEYFDWDSLIRFWPFCFW